MKQKSVMGLFFFVLISSSALSVHAENLEFLYTTTTVYDGTGVLNAGSAYTMPTGSNTYVGWIWFPFGFTIGNGATSGLNIIPPVDGTINLNDGTMTLTGDIIMSSNGMIGGNGTINGQDNAIHLTDQLSLNSSITFASNIIIDGDNNCVTLGSNAELWVSNNVTVTLQNIILKDLDGGSVASKIVMAGTESKLAFDNVTIWLDGDYTFSQGSLFFHNDVNIEGPSHSFNYHSGQKSYIAKQSQLMVEHGVTFSYGPSSRTNFVMADNTSSLYLNGCTLYSDATGLEMTNGTVIFDSLVTLSADGQTVGTALTFGTAGNNVTSIVLPGANMEVYGYIDVN